MQHCNQGGEDTSTGTPQGAGPIPVTNETNDPKAGMFGEDFLGQKSEEMYTLFKEACNIASVVELFLPQDEASLVNDVRKDAESVVGLTVNESLRSVIIVVSDESKDSQVMMDQQARVGLDSRVEIMETLNLGLHRLTQVLLATAPGYGNPVGEIVERVVKKACNSSNDACEEVLDYLMQNGIDIHVAEVFLCNLSEKDLGLFSTRGSDVI